MPQLVAHRTIQRDQGISPCAPFGAHRDLHIHPARWYGDIAHFMHALIRHHNQGLSGELGVNAQPCGLAGRITGLVCGQGQAIRALCRGLAIPAAPETQRTACTAHRVTHHHAITAPAYLLLEHGGLVCAYIQRAAAQHTLAHHALIAPLVITTMPLPGRFVFDKTVLHAALRDCLALIIHGKQLEARIGALVRAALKGGAQS